MKELTPSIHVAPLRHGLWWHSSMSADIKHKLTLFHITRYQKKKRVLCGCVYVYLFHSTAQCIQVHTHRHFVLLSCSRSPHSDTDRLCMAGELHKRHNKNGSQLKSHKCCVISNALAVAQWFSIIAH